MDELSDHSTKISTMSEENISSANEMHEDKETPATFEKVVRNFILFILLSSIVSFLVYGLSLLGIIKLPKKPIATPLEQSKLELVQFSSDAEFVEYFKNAPVPSYTRDIVALESAPSVDTSKNLNSFGATPARSSQTNIQVVAIDEPDVLKNDGQYVYYSSASNFYKPMSFESRTSLVPPDMPYEDTSKTRVIKAFPAMDLSVSSTIDKSGNLLISDNKLLVFSNNAVVTYDISEKNAPKELWKYEYGERNSLLDARLYNGQVYLMLQSQILGGSPCPIILREGPERLSVPCTSVYHPVTPVPVDSTFSIVTVDPTTGIVSKNTSFVGKAGSSIVYMSSNFIYITYQYTESPVTFMYDFFVTAGGDLIPKSVLDKLAALQGYSISEQAKITEMTVVLEEYNNSLTDDERLRVQNEMENRMQDYVKERARSFEKTGIAKVSTSELKVHATGVIPGSLLNQFSLDEQDGYLRIATTVGNNSWIPSDSANDIYIMNSNLEKVGELKDLGLTERIYSVRFMGNLAYVVTFRQIDPFYVIDVSNSRQPVKKGELKIPGYSSYLHALSDKQILGVGVEKGQLKLSLFDVSDSANPVEIDKYTMDEYGSETLSNHHAFLLDEKHRIFFIPASQGGYIFSYVDNKLELKKAVSGYSIDRAAYIDDVLYVFSPERIIAFNETDWSTVKEITLD